MQKYISKEVVCPFYKHEESRMLRCEGFCPSCTLQITFEKRDRLQLHKNVYCNRFKGYPHCPIYPVINKQYE